MDQVKFQCHFIVLHYKLDGFWSNTFGVTLIIIIIIIKICSAHISTLLGAQGAETQKHEYKQFTTIAKTTLCAEIHVQCNYKYTCDIRWVLSSDLNLVLLWQDLSLVGRWFQSLGAATEKDISPQVRFEVGSFRSDMLLERMSTIGLHHFGITLWAALHKQPYYILVPHTQ